MNGPTFTTENLKKALFQEVPKEFEATTRKTLTISMPPIPSSNKQLNGKPIPLKSTPLVLHDRDQLSRLIAGVQAATQATKPS